MRFWVSAVLISLANAAMAQPAQTGSHDTCVDVQVGSAQSYDCLNQRLRAAVQAAPRPSSATAAPYNATSPSTVTGAFNESAPRNRLGRNFGRSVTPERPAQSFEPAFGRPHS